MMEILPNGVLGLCIVGLLSAFMSTVSTQFNLGASYLINDIYKTFFVKDATEKHYVLASRIATALIAAVGMVLSYYTKSIAGMWQFVLSFASGAGVVWILRWFWWRINAWSEISVMLMSALVSSMLFLQKVPPPPTTILLLTVLATIPVFLVVTFLTQPVADETLRDFCTRVKPGQWGWRRVMEQYGIVREPFLGRAFMNFLLGTALLLAINFGVGTMLLRSAWLGGAEILLGGAIAVVMVKRVRHDSRQADQAVPAEAPPAPEMQPAAK